MTSFISNVNSKAKSLVPLFHQAVNNPTLAELGTSFKHSPWLRYSYKNGDYSVHFSLNETSESHMKIDPGYTVGVLRLSTETATNVFCGSVAACSFAMFYKCRWITTNCRYCLTNPVHVTCYLLNVHLHSWGGFPNLLLYLYIKLSPDSC